MKSEKIAIAKNQKSASSKKSIPAKKESASLKIDLKKINLSSLKSELDSIQIKEKKERESIYKYPAEFPKEKRNSDEGKSWRNARRNKRDSLLNNISYSAKFNKEKLQESIEKWNSFYKEFYLKNDYSIESISNSGNDAKNQNLLLGLKICRIALGMK